MKQNNNNISVLFEGLWVVIAIASVVMGTHATLKHGFKNSYTFFIITIIAILFYYLRRSQRINRNKE